MGAMPLSQKKVAILATDGFEQSELLETKKALEAQGAQVSIISPKAGEIKGWNQGNWGNAVKVDFTLEDAQPEGFDALVLPGGVMNPDKLRTNLAAIEFIRRFGQMDRPIAAICHGPWPLIEAGLVRDKRLTSWPSLKSDLRNAGADWVDEEVVRDELLITSRKPDDLPAFNKCLIEQLQAVTKQQMGGLRPTQLHH